MSRNEVIIEIMNLYDEVERLKTENREAKTYMNAEPIPYEVRDTRYEPVINVIMSKGKEKLLDELLSYWKSVTVNYDEDNDIYKAQSYENWLEEKIKKDRIPLNCSYTQVIEYLESDLKAVYKKEKTKALNKAKGIENVEDE